MKPKILVTRMLPQAALDIVRAACEVDLNERDVRFPKADLQARLQDKVGMVCLLTDTIDDEVLAAAPGLKVVSNVAVGYNNIDVAAATRRKVLVTNTPGVLDETTADLTWALLMATARRLVESDRFVRAGQWTEWMLMGFLGQDVHGKTLGICGLGRIGQAVARRARGFNMRILYTQRRRHDAALERELGATYVDKPTLLRQSDFVVLLVPLTAETTHYISTADFTLMKPTAILINPSRGPVVDEKALVKALQERRITAAGLDVFEREPQVEPELLTLEHVVLLPHIGSGSVETRTKMATMAATNCVAGVTGQRLPNLVNPEALP